MRPRPVPPAVGADGRVPRDAVRAAPRRATRRVCWPPGATPRSPPEDPAALPPAPRLPGARATASSAAVAAAPAPGGIDRRPLIALGVEHGARDLRVMRPGAPVQVVRPDGHPHIVDHTELPVDVDRPTGFVLQVVHAHAIPPCGAHHRQGLLLPDAVQRPRQRAVPVGVPGHHRDQPQLGRTPEGVGEEPRNLLRPQVLILDVDQGPGPRQRLHVRARDAPLAPWRERERWVLRRVGPQHLHRHPPSRGRIGQHRWQQACASGLAEKSPYPGPPRVPVIERSGVHPALAEGLIQVTDRRPPDLELHIVPGRTRPVSPIEDHGLRVALVALVVAPPVAEVDPADECDVLPGALPPPDDGQLLVV